MDVYVCLYAHSPLSQRPVGGWLIESVCLDAHSCMSPTEIIYCRYIWLHFLYMLLTHCSPPVYLHHATQSYLRGRLCHPVCLTFAMVPMKPAPAWRPTPPSALTRDCVSTGGTAPTGSVVRYSVNNVRLRSRCLLELWVIELFPSTEHKCPSNKVYLACGPAVEPTCNQR